MARKRAWIVYTFFPRRKKVSKKYAEGVSTLSTPRERRKTPATLSASHVLRRYWKFHSFIKRKKTQFVFCHSDCGLTQAVFYGNLEFCCEMGFSLMMSLCACVYGTQTGMDCIYFFPS